MEKSIISEDQIKLILDKVLIEEASKVRREEFNRVHFKTEDLENSLNETIKELMKLKGYIPDGLQTITNGRLSQIENNLSNSKKLLAQLRNKVKQYKKNIYSQQIESKKI